MAAFSGYVPMLLRALNAPDTPQNRLFLRLWQRAEGGSAANNPFNTTQPEHGSSNYNGVGVKNYGSPQQGLAATVQTLENGRYGNILGLLRSGHATAAQLGTALARSPWGTGSGVLRLLGSGPVSTPKTGTAPLSTGLLDSSTDPYRQLVTSYLFQQAQNALSGHSNAESGGAGLLGLALARKALAAAPSSSNQTAHHAAAHAQMTPGGQSPYTNLRFAANVDWQHVNPTLLQRVNRVAMSQGITVDINSGYRTDAHSIAVGGFAGDPHTQGTAIDAYVNGRPIGSVIPASVWRKFGITSGAVPGFYNGASDPEHLQL